jgi:transmembrane sensor
MRDFEHFVKLRKKYFSKTATPAEEAEYIRLFNSGQFEEIDNDAHKELWDSPPSMSEDDRKVGEEIHATLLSEHVSKSKGRGLQRQIVWLSAAASLVIFLSIGLWEYNKSISHETLAPVPELLSTISGPAFIKLPDTSTVELKAGSKLTYNKNTFGIKDRRLGLTGTAYFDVTHNKDLPFQVYSGKVITTVLGTAFNVEEGGGTIEVTVVRGKVSVGSEALTFSTLTPNEKITVKTTSMTYLTTSANTASEVAWKNKNLILDQLTMEEAIHFVEQRFNVLIALENESLKYCPVTAYFVNDESLNEILDVLCRLRHASYVITDKGIIIQNGEGCIKP